MTNIRGDNLVKKHWGALVRLVWVQSPFTSIHLYLPCNLPFIDRVRVKQEAACAFGANSPMLLVYAK